MVQPFSSSKRTLYLHKATHTFLTHGTEVSFCRSNFARSIFVRSIFVRSSISYLLHAFLPSPEQGVKQYLLKSGKRSSRIGRLLNLARTTKEAETRAELTTKEIATESSRLLERN
jgi:hypothetical protein